MNEEVVKKEKLSAQQEKEDLNSILSTSQGQRFLYRLLARCGVYKSSYDNSGSKVYFNEGERNIGLGLMADIELADPNGYLKILKAKKEIENG